MLKTLLLLAQLSGGNDQIKFDDAVHCGNDVLIQHALSQAGYEEKVTEPLSDKILFHLYVDNKGSWIMAVSNTQGINCMINSGEEWYLGKQLNGVQ